MFDIKCGTLQHWYKEHISDYRTDIDSGNWPCKSIIEVDQDTGEILQEQTVHIHKPENIGEQMSIDDKAIGHEGYTILSNTQTGKIAMMIDSCSSVELDKAMSLFGEDLNKVKSISCDMSPTYLKLCRNHLPFSQITIDKFHVMQYVYDAVLAVRLRIKKKLAEGLSKEKKRTPKDKEILYEMEQLNRCRHRLTQSVDKWSEKTTELMNSVFNRHKELKTAYDLSQSFKTWYQKFNRYKGMEVLKEELNKWYIQVKEADMEELLPAVKMISKHEDEILNFFSFGHSNAKAENLNGKIQRFVSANYGIKNKDFVLYRIAGYFS